MAQGSLVAMESIGNCQNTITLSGPEFSLKSAELVHTKLTEVQLNDNINLTGAILDDTQNEFESVINGSVTHIELFCRLCGLENRKMNMENIFGARGKQMDLQNKIMNHLHLQVEKYDQLPQNVCSGCICHLNICHQLYEISHTTDTKLRQMFLLPQDVEKSGFDSLPESIITDLKNVQQQEEMVATDVSLANEAVSEINSFKNIQDLDSLGSNPGKCKTEEIEEQKKLTKCSLSESSSTSLLCHICGKSFKLSKYLRAHKQTHLPDSVKKKHQCSLCSKSFRSRFLLSEHMNIHSCVMPYSCSQCGKLFHKRAQLKQHSLTHTDADKRHACHVCGLRFNRRSNLQSHLKVHRKDRKFLCRVCQLPFPSLGAMLSHRKHHSQNNSINNNQHQPENKGTQHKCPDCGKVLRSMRSLVYHRRSQHSTDRPYRCSYCPEGFMKAKLLEAHENGHNGEKPFKCEICSVGFRSRSNLVQHMIKHKNEKNFECIDCGKRFCRKSALKVHTRSHTGERPFICDACGRGFKQKNDLLKHQRVHTEPNSRTRTCELCLTVFSSSKELTKHKEEVHQEDANINIVPLIITSSMYETHIITEDGQRIVLETIMDENMPAPSTIVIDENIAGPLMAIVTNENMATPSTSE